MAQTRSSSGAIALTGRMASTAPDTMGTRGRDSFAAVATKSVRVPATKAAHSLPTPPNSISPNLPPHGLSARASAAASASTVPTLVEAVESDLDLHENHPGKSEFQHSLDAAGAITPSLLAKYHLPEILLTKGPLAIRHITGYLTTSVPGFSGIAPAKARRLVVGALEGRGSGGEGGGLDGDVEFEKVGWGRWDARITGQHSRQSGIPMVTGPTSNASYPQAMPINNSSSRPRPNTQGCGRADRSSSFSYEDDVDVSMTENEADKMSLDGDESCSSSEAPPDEAPQEDAIMADNPEDLTDDEDWAAVGAVALRQASYTGSGAGLGRGHVYSGGYRGGGGAGLMAKSMPLHYNPNFQLSSLDNEFQEREAVEALLRLGSV